jgi:uracil-DNA glycosylase family 4
MTPFEKHVARWRNCTRCELHKGRNKVVFTRGDIPASIAFVGESPGESENANGFPFCGPAGHLLQHDIIDVAVPKDVTYCLTNLVCCIPREEDGKKTAEPPDSAIKACTQRLQEFLRIVDPKLLICVGKLAEDFLQDRKYKHSIKLHREIPTVSIIHPSAIIRGVYSMRDLMVKRCIITVQNAIQEYVCQRNPET